MALTKVAMKINKAHDHTASIMDGVFSAGLCGLMNQGYNADSPSSWSHSLICTYPNSKRSIITIRGPHYRG